MNWLTRLFKRKSNYSIEKNATNTNVEDLELKFKQVNELFILRLKEYNSEHCQCAYPRFHQIAGIDCIDSGNSFKSYDTELFIDASKQYFDTLESNLKDENTNKKWICKKCSSVYEYGWSDFSIHIDRKKLKLVELNSKQYGKDIIKPIPLYLGLIGHSYPSYSEIHRVDFNTFQNYLFEKDE